MERRIEHLEDRLRALSGALRLRGVWPKSAEERVSTVSPTSVQVLRLRGSGRAPEER